MERRRRREAAMHDHSIAIAQPAMTHRAIDIESLLAALEHFARHREWHLLIVGGYGCVSRQLVPLQCVRMPWSIGSRDRHRASRQRPRFGTVRKRWSLLVRFVMRLRFHIVGRLKSAA